MKVSWGKNFNRFWEIAQILMHYESMKLHETTIDWQTANNSRYGRHFQSYSFADGLVDASQVSGRTFSSSSEQHTWRSLSGFSETRHVRRCPTSTLWPHLDFMIFCASQVEARVYSFQLILDIAQQCQTNLHDDPPPSHQKSWKHLPLRSTADVAPLSSLQSPKRTQHHTATYSTTQWHIRFTNWSRHCPKYAAQPAEGGHWHIRIETLQQSGAKRLIKTI